MAKATAAPSVGETLAYFAEGNPYSGPFPAKVTKVHPAQDAVDGKDAADRKPAEPLRVDLLVKFSNGPAEHTKTGVRVTDSPEKHCCTANPYSFDFDSWFAELDAIDAKRREKEANEAKEKAAQEAAALQDEAFDLDSPRPTEP